MSKSWFFLFLLLSLFHTCFLSSPSSSPTSIPQLCLQDERSALLELKKKHYHVYTNYDPLNSWKPNTDCCYWEGITCNGTTGHVVGLDLSDSSLHGSIHSNSTLFYLHQLQMLNLSRNVFHNLAPSGFHRLSRLLHLNLSDNYFSGQIPSQISQLTGLVSLDLSWNLFVGQISSEISSLTKLFFLDLSYNGDDTTQLEIPNLGAFVQNLSMLRELRIDCVDLSAQRNRDWCRHLSSALPNLHVLSMIDCSLTGPLDASISSLRFFSELYLDSNHYNLSSTVPSSLLNLTSLTVLSLYECGFYGDFPSNVFLLPNLKYIDLSENPLLLVHLPEFPQVNSTLQYLDVSNTKFQGKLPSSVGNINFLKELNLDGCNFSGPIPPFLANLTHLERLRLDDNLLQGPLLSYLFFLPSIVLLELANNQFSGVINEQQPIVQNISSFSSWVTIDLSDNHLKGQDLMRLISKIKGKIEFLDLSFNDFGYIDIVEDGNLSYVRSLSSNLSGENLVFNAQIQSLYMDSCNIGKFPDFLIRNQKDLAGLDLSNNRISKFPDFLGDLKALSYLDISSNRIDGAIPINLFSKATNYFSIAANKLTGKIPFSICNASNLDVLDLSNNRLSGNIPTCLGNSNLGVLNLEGNKLHGSIPSTFKNGCNLQTLKLNKNKLQGKVPRSLGNCEELEVLDMSDNQLNDTFPHWLENLSKLQVLVIRSNKFGGPIADQLSQVDSPFPSLHVIDLSFNNFIGNLPVQYICHWKAMMFDEVTSTMQYQTLDNYSGHYQDTLTIMDKGLYLHMPSVFNTFITIDLSNNNFEGKIPDVLGNLKALKVLNLSGNSLTGQIPFSLGNLSELESLDLSRNKLSGEIPRQLTDLTFLEVLNLSYNNFVGSIPQGRQFDTFLNASYEGNAGLCGSPLSRKCGVSDQTLPPTSITFQQNEDDSTCLLDWTFALAGCCSGLIIGLVIGQQLFWRKNRCSEFISRVVVSKQRKWSRKIKCNKEGK